MTRLRCTLVADGTSDRALIPLIERALHECAPSGLLFEQIASPSIPHGKLKERLLESWIDYPCDLLFVHRDAENQGFEARLQEIQEAVTLLVTELGASISHVPIIPVKMTEAWLIADEAPIREAVGNPQGSVSLGLPPISQVERVDAKKHLLQALTLAADLNTRRRQVFRPERYRHRVAELLPALGKLRRISSYQEFESRLKQALQQAVT